MISWTGPIVADSTVRRHLPQQITISVEAPAFQYSVAQGRVHREGTGFETVGVEVASDATNYTCAVPMEVLAGQDPELFWNWLYLPPDNTLDALALDLRWSLWDPLGVRMADGVHQAFLLPVKSPTFGAPTHLTVNGFPPLRLPEGPIEKNVSLVNAQVYRDLSSSLKSTDVLESTSSDFALAEALMQLQWLGKGRPREVPSLDEAERLAEGGPLSSEEIIRIAEAIPALTAFPILLDEVAFVKIAGQFRIRAHEGQTVPRSTLNLYRLYAEATIRTADESKRPVAFRHRWSESLPEIIEGPLGFTLEAPKPLTVNSVDGEIRVRVMGSDGAILWNAHFAPDDPALQNLQVEVQWIAPLRLGTDPAPQTAERKIRGQVLARPASLPVADLIVLIQARRAEDQLWRVVSAGRTAPGGYFSLDYPRGPFIEAQAMVSASPDSTIDLPILPGSDNERIGDDFLYLILSGEDEDKSGENCTCEQSPERLPDQSDLVRSGRFTQDLGTGCVNLSTPNRTLQEYRYTGIVRTSDPDVANYTLVRHISGSFELRSEGATIERAPVSLTNPIEWQDAPLAREELKIHQAVTVATGHILTFRVAVKADGYSLGELKYARGLAPGQKVQIAVYNAVDTLEASERQEISQGERLAAELVDERSVIDELTGHISETVSGRSSASTGGVSAGLGLGGSIGAISGTLGVAGGYASSNASASQAGARSLSQFFGEKLRQSLVQNAESYRRLNASIVTTVREGEEYAVNTEVISNHNHCHALTMMYFEVLRHYAVEQDIVGAQECVFVPLLLTNFTRGNISRWKEVLAVNLRPMPSAGYLRSVASGTLGFRHAHPLARAFDANERILTNYEHVDYPTGSYADEEVESVDGEITLRVDLPRPPTRFDRVLTLPIVTETVTTSEVDVEGTVHKAMQDAALSAIIPGFALFAGGTQHRTREETIQVRDQIFDHFMSLDANYRTVPPAQAIRVNRFRPETIAGVRVDFFDNPVDRDQWSAYARLLDLRFSDAYDLLEAYFKGRLISEFDTIYRRDIAPLLYRKIVNTIRIESLPLDLTGLGNYRGGETTMRVRIGGSGRLSRTRRALPEQMRLHSNSRNVHALQNFVTLVVENVRLRYATAHFSGTLFAGYMGHDLLDPDFDSSGVLLRTPLTQHDERNPRKEDEYAVLQLENELNSNLVSYNAVLWRGLDENQRYMLLDGCSIEVFDVAGSSIGPRSLASVVKNEIVAVVGNSLVMPVAEGYRVNSANIVSENEAQGNLLDHYRPVQQIEPYRLSVPTRGVFMEAVMGHCDACEMVKANSSQDWDRFRTDEPTSISAVTVPTPQRADWRANWKDFAQPLVQMQSPRAAPDPGAGLAALSELLGRSDTFRDLTGLAGTQDAAIRTYLSNQENARAFAEMAKSMAMQQHNSENSPSIRNAIDEAHQNGAITDTDRATLVRDHLRQQIDGGADPRAAEHVLGTIRRAREQGSIDATDEGQLARQTLDRLTNNGEMPSQEVSGLFDRPREEEGSITSMIQQAADRGQGLSLQHGDDTVRIEPVAHVVAPGSSASSADLRFLAQQHLVYERLSRIAYERLYGEWPRSERDWLDENGFEHIRYYEGQMDLEFHTFRRRNGSGAPIIAFRGSTSFGDMFQDIVTDLPSVGHTQFHSNIDMIRGAVEELGTPCIALGHSLGGALAQLAAIYLTERVSQVITFSSTGVNTTNMRVLSRAGVPQERLPWSAHWSTEGDTAPIAGNYFTPGVKLRVGLPRRILLMRLETLLSALPGLILAPVGYTIAAHRILVLAELERMRVGDQEAYLSTIIDEERVSLPDL